MTGVNYVVTSRISRHLQALIMYNYIHIRNNRYCTYRCRGNRPLISWRCRSWTTPHIRHPGQLARADGRTDGGSRLPVWLARRPAAGIRRRQGRDDAAAVKVSSPRRESTNARRSPSNGTVVSCRHRCARSDVRRSELFARLYIRAGSEFGLSNETRPIRFARCQRLGRVTGRRCGRLDHLQSRSISLPRLDCVGPLGGRTVGMMQCTSQPWLDSILSF